MLLYDGIYHYTKVKIGPCQRFKTSPKTACRRMVEIRMFGGAHRPDFFMMFILVNGINTAYHNAILALMQAQSIINKSNSELSCGLFLVTEIKSKKQGH